MTQQEHPTTEQLSAFLDKQLTPQEQAFFDAHLQSCQRCQGVLGELRRTVTMLHAMPQPQLPRSFTLPAGISHIPATRPQPQQRRVLPYRMQRAMRAVSTLAAVVAVIFILSGLLMNVHLTSSSGISTSSSSVPILGPENGLEHSPAVSTNITQVPRTKNGTPIASGHPTGTPTASPATTTPAPSATSKSAGAVKGVPINPPTLPPFLDISQPEGRLTLGALLLLLSIIGIIATRRRRDTVSYD